MSTVVKDLGAVSAYAYAVEKGYTGTEAEFAELMASYATVGQTAVTAAQTATTKAGEAQTSAQTASGKASEASQSATTASQKATEATQSAAQASGYASQAENAKTASQTAQGLAESARDDAITAKTAAVTAQGKAEDAQAAAESVAESIPSDYSQLSEDVSDLKEDLSESVSDLKSAFNKNNSGEITYFIVHNEYVKNTDGGFAPYNGWSRSDYIPINKYHSFACKSSVISSYNAFYNSEKEFIEYFYIRDTETTVTVPSSAYYMAISNTDVGMANTSLAYKTKDEYAIEGLQDAIDNDVFKATNGTVSSDYNNYVENGAYLVNSDITNSPYQGCRGSLLVFAWDKINRFGVTQIFVPHDETILPLYRFCWDYIWTDWQNFAESNFDVTTVVFPSNENVLSPDNFTLRGYINASDGETFVENTNYICTNDFIDIPFGIGTIYAKFPQVENNDRIACFLFYDADGNYKFSASGRFSGADFKTAVINATNDVAKFKFWVNKTTVSGGSNDVELAFSNPSTFEAYESSNRVSNSALETPAIYLPLSDKHIVCFGDSIFGNKRTPFGVTDALKEITGATVYNMGFGGCNMAAKSSPDWDAFSMYRLAYAIAHNDFSVQNAVDVDNVPNMHQYFKTSLAQLKTIDFNNVDYITIAFGTNDFTGDVVIDNQNNLLDCDTFKGALRYSLEQIITAFPHIKIFVCGQTWRFWMDSSNVFVDDSDTHENGNGDKLTDFVVATKSVCDEYHVPFIDNYNIGINKINRSYYFPANDGTHQNYLGAKLIAEHIKHEVF